MSNREKSYQQSVRLLTEQVEKYLEILKLDPSDSMLYNTVSLINGTSGDVLAFSPLSKTPVTDENRELTEAEKEEVQLIYRKYENSEDAIVKAILRKIDINNPIGKDLVTARTLVDYGLIVLREKVKRMGKCQHPTTPECEKEGRYLWEEEDVIVCSAHNDQKINDRAMNGDKANE